MPRIKKSTKELAVEELRKRMDELRSMPDTSEDHIRQINILSVKLYNARKRCYYNHLKRAMSYPYDLPIQFRKLTD